MKHVLMITRDDKNEQVKLYQAVNLTLTGAQ